ncbi:nitronate monooxygenase [Dactylosporangium vinaceum]|uniref:Propionate 3-nitronate monooxygenase n=1 Tax=Dactylosporangium vinaceum TaxID=53362 RepID=A0ABV5M896_9ACTN|nr:nitronate monooxygenase [Dactylosporangium vinaceum]UAB94274.1 nitronate monooxygenase [Dactylosporangium vinaceum]
MSALLGVSSPVLAAPMAGGPSTPSLVLAAARAGSLGFLAAGYRTAADLAAQLDQVRGAFGVNVFAPNPVPVDPEAFRRYARELQPEADAFGLDLAGAAPVENDDDWAAKIDLLLARPVPVVSFTFALPPAATVAALRRTGSVVLQTVTSTVEARGAALVGVDGLIVQSCAAGAHSGTFTPAELPADRDLADVVRAVGAVVDLPLIAAGGIGTPADVTAALAAGAQHVMVGTALLRTDESGAGAVHRAALAAGAGETVLTRAFSGRPARALRNGFVDRHHASAPSGYPAVHHLTTPLRRAAAQAGDADRVNLWAGTGFRHARTGPAAAALDHLAGKA